MRLVRTKTQGSHEVEKLPTEESQISYAAFLSVVDLVKRKTASLRAKRLRLTYLMTRIRQHQRVHRQTDLLA